MNEAINYYEEYKGSYLTTAENQTTLPIVLDNTQYRADIDILNVYINGMLETEYSIVENNIVLEEPLDVIGTKVDYVAMRSIVTSVPFSSLKGDKGDPGQTGSSTTIKRWGDE